MEQAKSVPSYLSEQANALLQKVSIAWDKLAHMPAGVLVYPDGSMTGRLCSATCMQLALLLPCD